MQTGNKIREKNGRFKDGHPPLSRGNPLHLRANKLRWALLKRVTKQDIEEVVDMLLEKAKGGDVIAARELLNRTIGKPTQPLEIQNSGGKAAGLNIELVIIQALAAFPQAKIAVAEALRKLEYERTSGTGEST
jgi:hypothetical protein